MSKHKYFIWLDETAIYWLLFVIGQIFSIISNTSKITKLIFIIGGCYIIIMIIIIDGYYIIIMIIIIDGCYIIIMIKIIDGCYIIIKW